MYITGIGHNSFHFCPFLVSNANWWQLTIYDNCTDGMITIQTKMCTLYLPVCDTHTCAAVQSKGGWFQYKCKSSGPMYIDYIPMKFRLFVWVSHAYAFHWIDLYGSNWIQVLFAVSVVAYKSSFQLWHNKRVCSTTDGAVINSNWPVFSLSRRK